MKLLGLLLLGFCVGAAVVDAGCLTMPSLLSVDTSTTLSIRKKADGIVVQKLCPGVDYVVTVRFPEPRQFKAFVSTGIWEALTGPCANHTEKTIAQTTWELPLTLPCDPIGSLIKLKIASKVEAAASFLGKNISFPLNPLASCPKSRCNIPAGTSNATVTQLLTGVPLFDLFSKTGVVFGLGANQLLTFDVFKMNKTLSPEVFLQALMGIHQFKMMADKTLLDPTMILSLLGKYSSSVVQNGTLAANSTTILFYKETTKLLTLWPTFWGVKSPTGLFISSTTTMASQVAEWAAPQLSSFGGMAESVAALQSVYNSYAASKSPADSMLSVMSALGNVMSESDGFSASTASVSVSSFLGLMASYNSFLSLVK